MFLFLSAASRAEGTGTQYVGSMFSGLGYADIIDGRRTGQPRVSVRVFSTAGPHKMTLTTDLHSRFDIL